MPTAKKKLSDDVYKDSIDVLESILTCREGNDGPAFRDKAFQELDTLDESFINSCKSIGDRIAMSTRELPQILRALNGRYIEPGLTGSLSLGKTDALPTGRNLYTTDVRELPTWAAWQVGQNLARNLLERYIKDEGRFPQSIGINLWSIDAFKSDGEVFLPRKSANGYLTTSLRPTLKMKKIWPGFRMKTPMRWRK